jgi:hypothetical protein
MKRKAMFRYSDFISANERRACMGGEELDSSFEMISHGLR